MSEEIIIGSASTNEGKQIYLENRRAVARKVLERYPNLQSVFGDFRFINKENQTDNAFFNVISSGEAEHLLDDFEKILNEVNSLPKQRRNQIISRLCETGENNFKLFEEFSFYSELLKNNKISEIHYENALIGNHDFRVIINSAPIDIEVTSLGKTPFQIKVEEGFNLVCEEIIKDLPNSTRVQLDLILDRIPIKKETTSLEIEKSVLDNYQVIKKIILIDANGLCRIENIGNSEKFLIQDRELFPYYYEFGKRLSKLEIAGENFLETTKEKDIFNNAFGSFITGPARDNRVEIHTECISPSKAEELRKDSLIEQIKRNIKQKLLAGQLKGKINPILALRFDDFAFMNYWDNSDFFSQQILNELKKIVQEIFKEQNEKEVLGILLYERGLKNSVFIENPNLNLTLDILNKIKLLSS